MLNGKKITKGAVARFLLTSIGLAGLLIVGVAAPNIFKALPRGGKQDSFSKSAVDRSLAKLKRRGLVRFVRGITGWRVELTGAGKNELRMYDIGQKLIKKPNHWDGHWHILIFDIEERKKSSRELVRRTLANFGFFRLQDSVWVYPYECEEILELLRTKFRVRNEAIYIHAQRIAKDNHLLKYFNLSSS